VPDGDILDWVRLAVHLGTLRLVTGILIKPVVIVAYIVQKILVAFPRSFLEEGVRCWFDPTHQKCLLSALGRFELKCLF
jgi:hypothetical protein